ncbi:Chitinase 8 [Dichanthelium oligosanthes]|uniref:chitinase n=1 Tax=Dichanthelium oligosanthes TaxID=888268 RepID=A0A1E5WFF3_9POAL|nr:Chitinase 8 [Dichanthelium oligosanthes]
MARLAVVACAAAMAVLLGVAAADVGSIITQDVYNAMLPNRDNSICPANGFYTYDAFIQAANSFSGFGTSGSDEQNKRELAAFFGQTSHETNGGAAGQYTWGYCFKEEISKATDPPYYGRGPIQLTGQANYQQAGNAIGVDLVSNPDLVASDPVISFKTAIWFWMTAQSPKPSCHDVILGNWTPSSADNAAGRVPGYGVITNIINGGIECGMGPNAANVNRIGYYQRYCDIFGVSAGDNLDCYSQQHF